MKIVLIDEDGKKTKEYEISDIYEVLNHAAGCEDGQMDIIEVKIKGKLEEK